MWDVSKTQATAGAAEEKTSMAGYFTQNKIHGQWLHVSCFPSLKPSLLLSNHCFLHYPALDTLTWLSSEGTVHVLVLGPEGLSLSGLIPHWLPVSAKGHPFGGALLNQHQCPKEKESTIVFYPLIPFSSVLPGTWLMSLLPLLVHHSISSVTLVLHPQISELLQAYKRHQSVFAERVNGCPRPSIYL